MSTVTNTIHLYALSPMWVVPTVAVRSNGIWVEIEPVRKIEINDANALTNVLSELKLAKTINIGNQPGWDGSQVWENAEKIIHVYIYNDGSVKLSPQIQIPIEIDPESSEIVDGGWQEDESRVKTLSSKTSIQEIAELLLRMV